MRWSLVVCLLCLPLFGGGRAVAQDAGSRSITYVGVTYDRTDLQALGIGAEGFWFPQFAASTPVTERPTGENARDALPSWVTPFNHVSGPFDLGCDLEGLQGGCLPTYVFRTFSQDGPARSAGGHPDWSALVPPDGKAGRSGAIVDPHTRGNVNNTINRIQLTDGAPSTFYLHVLTDNTKGEHDPTGRIQARGNIGPLDADVQVEADTFPRDGDLVFNGIADVYTFRYDGFVPGDYLKVRLSGDATGGGASFGGLLFDERIG